MSATRIGGSDQGRDDPRGSAAAERLLGVAMIAILAFGLWQGIAALRTQAAERQFGGKLSLTAILAGTTASAVNTIMAHDLPTDGLWRSIGGVLRWRIFGSAGTQAWVGTQNWLYLTDELRPWPNAAVHMRARGRIIRAVADRLHDLHIDLVVAIVPDKARIEQATLGDAPRSAQAIDRSAAFAAVLRGQQVAFVDLDAVLSQARRDGPVFNRTDTHWNQRGAAVAATAVASVARLPPSMSYRTEAAPEETDGPGDLLHVMSLDGIGPRWAPLLRPLPDRQHVERTVPLAPNNDSASQDGGLLDDAPPAPVALIGSSFSLNANFSGRLQEALHATVTNFARLGGGFAASAAGYFTGVAFKETPPRLVVWEIPERVVGQPLADDDRALADWAELDPNALLR